MISSAQIHTAQLKATQQAAREHRTPIVFWPADLATKESMYSFCQAIPNLGDYTPDGYKRVNVRDKLPYHLDYFFVDATGVWENTYHEAALSIGEFRDMLQELYRIDLLESPVGLNGRYDVGSTYSLGIWDAGQFQVNIALYQEVK